MSIHDRLGRRHAPDPRDQNYPLRALVPQASTRTYRYWRPSFDVDQTGPTCVANSWAHYLGDSPIRTTLDALDGQYATTVYHSRTSGERGFRAWLYDQAQHVDEWHDTPPEGGTSVRAGAKVLHGIGLISGYYWAYTLQTVVDALLDRGPVVIGVNWYEGMFKPPGGWLYAVGHIVGGHAVVLDGTNTREEKCRVQTWGSHYWMRYSVLARLLGEDGEAVVATEPEPPA